MRGGTGELKEFGFVELREGDNTGDAEAAGAMEEGETVSPAPQAGATLTKSAFSWPWQSESSTVEVCNR